MILAQSHTLFLILTRDRAAEAIAWLFPNVELFSIKHCEFRGPLGREQHVELTVGFPILDDAAKFKMLFGDDEDNFA